jgi:hypothetical protein
MTNTAEVKLRITILSVHGAKSARVSDVIEPCPKAKRFGAIWNGRYATLYQT